MFRPWLVGALPTIPTQFRERRDGFDAAYRFKFGRRFFLQYKVANAAEQRTGSNPDVWDAWRGPYLRAWLLRDPTGAYAQHNTLVAFAATGEDVYYCAPLFHTYDDLATHALASAVRHQSLFAPLRDMHPVGAGTHSISYPRAGGHWRLHSEVDDAHDGVAPASVLEHAERREFSRSAFYELLHTLRTLTDTWQETGPTRRDTDAPPHVRVLGPLAEIDWLLAKHALGVLVLVPERRPRRRSTQPG